MTASSRPSPGSPEMTPAAPRATFCVRRGAWIALCRPEKLLPVLLGGSEEGVVWRTLSPNVPGDGEAADKEFLRELGIVSFDSKALHEATRRGSILRVAAFASTSEFVLLLCQFEPTAHEGSLRVKLSPALPALAREWDYELGRIQNDFETARRHGEPEAMHVRDESLRALQSRFSERLVMELPHAAHTYRLPWKQHHLTELEELIDEWNDTALRELEQRWQNPAALHQFIEEWLLEYGSPLASDGVYDLILVPYEAWHLE